MGWGRHGGVDPTGSSGSGLTGSDRSGRIWRIQWDLVDPVGIGGIALTACCALSSLHIHMHIRMHLLRVELFADAR